MADAGVVTAYDSVIGEYEQLPFVSDVKTNLHSYVGNKALDGVFYYVAAEEKEIRENPAERSQTGQTPDLFIQYQGDESALRMSNPNSLKFLTADIKPFATMLGNTYVLSAHESTSMEKRQLKGRYLGNMLEIERLGNNAKNAFKASLAIKNSSAKRIDHSSNQAELIDPLKTDPIPFSKEAPFMLPKRYADIISNASYGRDIDQEIKQAATDALSDFSHIFLDELQTQSNNHPPLKEAIGSLDTSKLLHDTQAKIAPTKGRH